MIADADAADDATEAEECTCYELDGFWYVARYCPVHVEEVDTGGLL